MCQYHKAVAEKLDLFQCSSVVLHPARECVVADIGDIMPTGEGLQI